MLRQAPKVLAHCGGRIASLDKGAGVVKRGE
jgi:hypothetical protein